MFSKIATCLYSCIRSSHCLISCPGIVFQFMWSAKEIGVDQSCTLRVGFTEIHVAEIGLAKISTVQDRSTEIGSRKHCSIQVGIGEISVGEDGRPEIYFANNCGSERCLVE